MRKILKAIKSFWEGYRAAVAEEDEIRRLAGAVPLSDLPVELQAHIRRHHYWTYK